MRWIWPWAPVTTEFSARAGIPVFATLSAVGYGLALSFTALSLFPAAELRWWFFLLLFVTAITGVVGPLLRDSNGVNVGRFVLGLVWLVLPPVIGSLAAIAGEGWSVDELLLKGVVPGALLLGAFVHASSLGDCCLYLLPAAPSETASPMEVEARRALTGFLQLARTAFKSWCLLALLGTGIIESALRLGDGRVRWIGLGLGALVGVGAMLFSLALAYVNYRVATVQAGGDEEVVVVRKPIWSQTLPIVGVVAFCAWLLPRDVSPIARYGLRGLFQSLSEIVGPWFVPGKRRHEGAGSDLMRSLADRLLPRLQAGGESSADEGLTTALLQAFVMTLIIVAVVWTMWRFLRMMRRRDHPEGQGPGYGGRGLLVDLFVWLWESLRSLLQTFRDWAGSLAPVGEREEQRKAKKNRRALRRKETQRPSTPAEKIRHIFARWLAQMERLGYPRLPVETPFEYANRIAKERPDVRAELQETAGIYVQARYSAEQEPSVLERAYQALKASIEEVVQIIRRKSVDPQ